MLFNNVSIYCKPEYVHDIKNMLASTAIQTIGYFPLFLKICKAIQLYPYNDLT